MAVDTFIKLFIYRNLFIFIIVFIYYPNFVPRIFLKRSYGKITSIDHIYCDFHFIIYERLCVFHHIDTSGEI